MDNYTDMGEVQVGNTRGSRSIDRIFVNITRAVTESGMLEPLETEGEGEDRRRSDHRVAYCRMEVTRRETYHWERYSYRHYNEESVKKFRD